MPSKPVRRLSASARLAALVCALTLSGCGVAGLSTSVGPTRGKVLDAPAKGPIQGMRIVDIDEAVVRTLGAARSRTSFADSFGEVPAVGTRINVGDALDVTIWEAPPAALFGAESTDARLSTSPRNSRPTTLPEFLVGPTGRITIPFAGQVAVVGRTPQEIEREIVSRLSRKAHLPQVIVRIIRNATQTVTVVGEVPNALVMPLTPRGERLLDALAAAGGTRQPVGKMTLQVSRDGAVRSMALNDVIRDPRQNITLQVRDVVTAIFQPFSFTVLGAAGRNDEITFEATGVTLSQALGRLAGLQDQRADPKGVFLFRWEEPDPAAAREAGVGTGPDGRVPTIYRVDLSNPATYLTAQNFPMQDKDVIYISNSPLAEFQRFVNTMASTVLPIVTVDNALSNN